MAAKKKAKKPPQARKKPTTTLIERAIAKKAGAGNPRAGVRDTPYRQRRNFRHYDGESIQIVWDWAALRDASGNALFTQREIADYLGMSVGAVGNMCRCMPENWRSRK